MARWEFRIRGFAGGRHRNGAPPGTLLVEAVHSAESSADVEIEAWQARMRRGEVSHAELIDLRPGGTLTDLHVDEHTRIPWSWTKTKGENNAA